MATPAAATETSASPATTASSRNDRVSGNAATSINAATTTIVARILLIPRCTSAVHAATSAPAPQAGAPLSSGAVGDVTGPISPVAGDGRPAHVFEPGPT